MKVFSVVQTKNDIDRLQNDLLNLGKWSQDWLMLFNVDKCKVMHIGLNNNKANYEMNGKYLEEVTEERDLGVVLQTDLKCSKQCLEAVSTANRVLGMIRRSFSVRDRNVILQLYKSLQSQITSLPMGCYVTMFMMSQNVNTGFFATYCFSEKRLR